MARTQISADNDVTKVKVITFGGSPLVKWYIYKRSVDGDIYMRRESNGILAAEKKIITCSGDIADLDVVVDPTDATSALIYFLDGGEVKTYSVTSSPIGEEPALISCDLVLNGYAFAFTYSGAITYAPNDDNESISAPTGARDMIFGVRGSIIQPNWRGFIKSTASSIYRVWVDRYSDGKLVLALGVQSGQTFDIVGAADISLGTLPSESYEYTAIMCFADDGLSLEWGPRYVKLGTSPTPAANTIVLPSGLTVRDDVILLSCGWSLGSDTSPQNPTLDIDGGGKTLTYPRTANDGGAGLSNRAQVLIKLDPADGSVGDAVMNAVKDDASLNGEQDFWMTAGATWHTTSVIARFPDLGHGNPSISDDGLKAAHSIHLRNINGTTDAEIGESSDSPILYANNNNTTFYYGGVHKIDLSTAKLPSDWARLTDNGFATGNGAAINRGGTAFDSGGNIYFGVNWYLGATNTGRGLERYPTAGKINASSASEQMMVKVDSDGALVWQNEMSATGSKCDILGVWVNDAETEVTYLWRGGLNRNPVIESATAALTFANDHHPGDLIFVTLNASTGAAIRAARICARDNSDITQGGEMYSPINLGYDPTDGLLRIGAAVVDTYSGGFRLRREVANSAGNGAKTTVFTGDGSGSATNRKFLVINVDPADLTVDSVEELAEGNGTIDIFYHNDIRA